MSLVTGYGNRDGVFTNAVRNKSLYIIQFHVHTYLQVHIFLAVRINGRRLATSGSVREKNTFIQPLRVKGTCPMLVTYIHTIS